MLTGEESFRWVAGPYDGYPDGDWEPFDAFMAAVHDRYWSDSEAENPPETLTLDRLAVADIVGGESRSWCCCSRTGAIIIWCSTERAERSAAHPFPSAG